MSIRVSSNSSGVHNNEEFMVVGINTNDQRTTQAKLQLKFPLFFKEKILPNLKLVFYDSLFVMLFIKGSISYSKEVIKNPWIGICYCATHLGFLTSNAVNSEATFHIVQQAEILTSLFNGDDI